MRRRKRKKRNQAKIIALRTYLKRFGSFLARPDRQSQVAAADISARTLLEELLPCKETMTPPPWNLILPPGTFSPG
jgi:hypothetical protein